MSTNKHKLFWKNSKWLLLASLILIVIVPLWYFPSERDYQRLLENAESIEIQYLPAPNYTKYMIMAKIPGSDTSSLGKLSASIDFCGIWFPFTDLSGNVYRIRVAKKDGSQDDVIVLGANKIRYGKYWNIAISPKAVHTIKQVAIESGGRLPNKKDLFELLDSYNNSAEYPTSCDSHVHITDE